MSGRYAGAVETQRRNDQFDDVFRAIAESDESPTKREIALETNRSSGQIQRILRDLRDRDRVRKVSDDEDGRIVRYEISPGTDR